jgi:hypothetical protein
MRGLTAEEGSDFVAIAADGHGAPTAAMGAGIIVKKQSARRIGTAADGRARAFDEKFGGGASQGRKEPVEATLARDKFERPDPFLRDKLIVALGDAQDLVDGLGPGGGERFAQDHGCKDGPEGFAKTQNAEENGVDRLRFCFEKRTKTGSAILRNKARIHEERNELVPGKIACGRREIGEIECQSTGDELQKRRGQGRSASAHLTCVCLQDGYTRTGRLATEKTRGRSLAVRTSGGVEHSELSCGASRRPVGHGKERFH